MTDTTPTIRLRVRIPNIHNYADFKRRTRRIPRSAAIVDYQLAESGAAVIEYEWPTP